MKRGWFLYFFKKSVSQRKGRIAIASFSVMLAVAIVTGLFGITSGIKDKLGSELKAYGANVIVSSGRGDYLDYDALDQILKLDGVESAMGQVFGRAFIRKESVEVIGLEMGRMRESGWRLDGSWPQNEREIIAGQNLKEALQIEQGESISLQTNGRITEFTVSGFIERGGPEDKAFIVSITQAWELMGIGGKLSVLLVRTRSGDLDKISSRVENNLTGAIVKTLRQVAVAEASLLGKMQMLMVIVTIVVFFAAVVSIMSTMGANVLERREEIGLMKAIGATRNNIRVFYIAEALLIGLTGGAAGYLIGYLFTQAVSWGAFDSFIKVPLYLSLLSVAVGVITSLIASHFPVSDALKYNPAVILREE
ncbi:MAG: ABC transporter permease [Nitrospiraceae bacterium]|nr:MAG: ABC transporter permease [Nitrospiraceae bacterium]